MESQQPVPRPGQVLPSKTFADLLNRYLQSDLPSGRSAVAVEKMGRYLMLT